MVLASSSPRRRLILEQGGYDFRTSSVKVSEIVKENLNLEEQIEDLSRQKAQALVNSGKLLKKQGILVLSGDTVVVLDGRILGKPRTIQESRQTLVELSGRKHEVITGVCLWRLEPEEVVTFHEISQVKFRELNDQEIDDYVASGEGMDKAGSYGIQGEARKFVEKFEGSYNNIVGLPLEKLEEVLRERGWRVAQRKS